MGGLGKICRKKTNNAHCCHWCQYHIKVFFLHFPSQSTSADLNLLTHRVLQTSISLLFSCQGHLLTLFLFCGALSYLLGSQSYAMPFLCVIFTWGFSNYSRNHRGSWSFVDKFFSRSSTLKDTNYWTQFTIQVMVPEHVFLLSKLDRRV